MFDGIGRRNLAMVFNRECEERQRIGDPGIEDLDRFLERSTITFPKVLRGAIGVYLGDLSKHAAQRSRDLKFMVLRDMCKDVATEMDGAALPGCALQHRCDRRLHAFMRVADR